MEKKRGKVFCLLLLLTLLIISACGGGGGGSSSSTPATQSIAGIWIGTSTSNVLHSTSNVTGIIAESNIARFASTTTGAQYSGVVTVIGNSFSSTATAYAPFGYMFLDGSHVGPVNISGTFTSKASMSGTYDGVGDTGTFSLTYSSVYDRPSSLTATAGTWAGVVSGYTNTITIDSSGNISGNSTSGCSYTGTVSIIDSSYNTYMVNLNIANCGVENGSYSGLGALVDTASQNDTFITSVSNSSYSYVASLTKQ
jgi:hypothetical protein